MMFCNKCGREIPADSQFCPGCGAALNYQPAEATPPPVAPIQTEEVILAECRHHWIVMVPWFLAAFACLCFTGLCIYAGVWQPAVFFVLVAAVCVLMAVWQFKSGMLRISSGVVAGNYGIIHRVKQMSPVNKVQDVAISAGPIGRALGYANIYVSTAGSGRTEYVYHNMTGAEDFQRAFLSLSK